LFVSNKPTISPITPPIMKNNNTEAHEVSAIALLLIQKKRA